MSPSAKAFSGMWQVAQLVLLLPESLGSKNNFFPSSTLAGVVGLSPGDSTFRGKGTSFGTALSDDSAMEPDDRRMIKPIASCKRISDTPLSSQMVRNCLPARANSLRPGWQELCVLVIVVVLTPCFNLCSSIVDRKEPVFVQALRAKTTVRDSTNTLIRAFSGIAKHFRRLKS